jgi:D-hydroxyproline dehydrogenase subunit gamma
MHKSITVNVNGKAVVVPLGSTVAVAVMLAETASRRSVTGEPRAPLCGMGVCFECRVSIGDDTYCRSCQILCQPGMEVSTDDYGKAQTV